MQVINQVITPEMQEIKEMIWQTVLQRDALKQEVEAWYKEHPKEKYPSMHNLILVDAALSTLDSCYKNLWDYNNIKTS
ncbi:hypothetical protein [Sulfurimonas sp.]|uniref:hypothetical protein n=1 Tax=Sulfurimonas sp. TaxID=2022749 RepID=UPI0039E47DB6